MTDDPYNFGGLRMKRWTNDGKTWFRIPPHEPSLQSASHWGLYPQQLEEKLRAYEGRHAQKLNEMD